LLRREGLYGSHLTKWRQAHRKGVLGASRGRKPDPETELKQQMRRLERDNERLQRKLRQAEAIIEVPKKISEILGISLGTPEDIDETS
jgi:transposase-like protein